jgi:hypothetical protein
MHIVTIRRNIDGTVVMTKICATPEDAERYLASWTRTPGYFGDIAEKP